MELKLKSILGLTEEQANNSKIELNMKAGASGDEYLNIWLKYSDYEKEEGICSECSYWGWYGEKQMNFYPGQWVFSFIRMSAYEWLMISAAEILDVPKNDRILHTGEIKDKIEFKTDASKCSRPFWIIKKCEAGE